MDAAAVRAVMAAPVAAAAASVPARPNTIQSLLVAPGVAALQAPFKPWTQEGWVGITQSDWACSPLKNDEYLPPTGAKGCPPHQIFSFGCCIKGMPSSSKNWRCMFPKQAKKEGGFMPCGEMLDYPQPGNIWRSCVLSPPQPAHFPAPAARRSHRSHVLMHSLTVSHGGGHRTIYKPFTPIPLVVYGGRRLMAGGERPGEWGCRKYATYYV